MLRINLLPPYVFDKQKKNKVWAGWILGILMIIIIYFVQNNTALAAQEVAQKKNDDAKALLKQKQGFDDQTTKEKTRIAETQQKQDFIAAAQSWNDEWWKLYSAMRDVTSPKVILRKMYLLNSTTVNIVGWAPSEKEAADWWINFRNKYTGPNGPYANVAFDLPKNGYPPGEDNPGGSSGAPASSPGRGGPVMQQSTAGGFGGGGSSPGSNAGNDKDEDPGPGFLEDRLGIYFRVHVTLKAPFDGGKSVPVWPPADAAGATGASSPGAMALPGGARPGGSAPGGAPAGGASSSEPSDDSGSGGKKSKRGAGGEE